MFEMRGKYSSAKVMIDSIDQSTAKQIQEMVNHPAATNPVAIMPDTHAGKGCVIGFTMKVSEKVVPNWVGVDVGCGVLSVKMDLTDLSDEVLKILDVKIRQDIPMGMSVNNACSKNLKFRFIARLRAEAINSISSNAKRFQGVTAEDISKVINRVGMSEGRFWTSLGTLGGGNHFIEIGRDESGFCWITVHTGSRNFGKTVCEFFDNMAQDLLKSVEKQLLLSVSKSSDIISLREAVKRGEGNGSDIGRLIDEKRKASKRDFDIKTSSYLSGWEKDDYLSFMFIAQVYAKFNRELIVERISETLSSVLDSPIFLLERVEAVHNFIDFVDGIVRKGAIRSYSGEKIVIPFNMRDGLLICEGRSNAEWNFSAPHGAGRIFSRRGAKESISLEDYKKSMEGIFTTSVGQDTIDESPMAYKDAKLIEEAISPTAIILNRVKPIYNVKAGSE